MKKKLIITLSIVALASALTLGIAIPKIMNNTTTVTTATESATASNGISLHEMKYKDAITKEDTNTTINLGNTITIDGENSGVTIDNNNNNNNTVTITSAGSYNITGTLSDGQIIINTEDSKNVKILLNGVNITSSTGPAINIINGDTIFTLADNTQNILTDSSNYNFEENTDEPDSTIFSKDDITFNGTGTLTVNANYKSAIKSKNDLTFLGGTYNITSLGDAIKGKDSVIITDGTYNITSTGDSISSTNTEEDTGHVEIHNGNFNLTSEKDGIQAESNLIILDGNFDIKTGGGSENSTKSNNPTLDGNMTMPDGNTKIGTPPNNGEMNMPNGNNKMGTPSNGNRNTNMPSKDTSNESSTDETNSVSQKALKSSATLEIDGGTFNINSCDDSIHSNVDTIINNGEINIESGDKGIHGDTNVEINGGTINITKSYEGLEASYITINDGTVKVVASDDDLNASDGSGTDTFNPGQVSDSDLNITVNGGYLTVDASGDGLDSNGSIFINGGTTLVNSSVSGADSTLDSDGKIQINGGILVATGSSGMVEAPDSSSTQNVINATLTSKEANTLINVQDENGNNIITYAPSKAYSSVIISTPKLESNKTYTVSYGGASDGTSEDGIYSSYSGGTKIGTVTTSSTVNNISENGATNSSNFQKGGQGRGQKGNMNNSTTSSKSTATSSNNI